MQRTTVSVGPALRKVREGRDVTLEEAARDTRVRLEFLEAIEAEDFHLLLGDVHLRGCLRTYATYLRLSPDKVVAMYEAEVGRDDEVVVVPPPVRSEPVLGARRRRDDHRLWILVAATVLVLAGASPRTAAGQPVGDRHHGRGRRRDRSPDQRGRRGATSGRSDDRSRRR